jgi:hypothetical protein
MMKFEIKNRWTGAVKFTAEIDCADDAPHSVKIGLAVMWAVKNKANMEDANMAGANMAGANMEDANMAGANMAGANMARANMADANMAGANMEDANMADANMAGANMARAMLADANMAGANMARANMAGANGVNAYIKCIQIDTYTITYTSDVMQIGCERHTIADWSGFSDAQVRAMDGVKALAWWRKYKDWIFNTIALCPAEPKKPAA